MDRGVSETLLANLQQRHTQTIHERAVGVPERV